MATVQAARDEQLLIGGEWGDATSGARFDVTNPANGEVVGTVPNGTVDDVQRAIDAAAAALEEWRSPPAIQRARILRRSADLIRERVDEIGAVMTAEQGKPLAEARGEVEYAASFFEWFAGEAERVYGQVVPPMKADEPRARAAPGRRRHRRDHAVELPRRDDDPQARPGDGRGLHEHRQAGVARRR